MANTFDHTAFSKSYTTGLSVEPTLSLWKDCVAIGWIVISVLINHMKKLDWQAPIAWTGRGRNWGQGQYNTLIVFKSCIRRIFVVHCQRRKFFLFSVLLLLCWFCILWSAWFEVNMKANSYISHINHTIWIVWSSVLNRSLAPYCAGNWVWHCSLRNKTCLLCAWSSELLKEMTGDVGMSVHCPQFDFVHTYILVDCAGVSKVIDLVNRGLHAIYCLRAPIILHYQTGKSHWWTFIDDVRGEEFDYQLEWDQRMVARGDIIDGGKMSSTCYKKFL